MAGIDNKQTMQAVLERFVQKITTDPELANRCKGIKVSLGYELNDLGLNFYTNFDDGTIIAGLGQPAQPSSIVLEMDAETFDGMMTGEVDVASAAISGKLSFSGDIMSGMRLQVLQDDMTRVYQAARSEVINS